MNTSLNWIKAMVPGLECTDQEFRDAMTLSGTKVECFNAFDKNLDKIVVGQILSVERHPDADKLVICQVNVGSENLVLQENSSQMHQRKEYIYLEMMLLLVQVR